MPMECGHEVRVFTGMDWQWDNDLRDEKQVETYEYRWDCSDIDLHRFQCNQCKRIYYYSGAAKDHYEKGTPLPFADLFEGR